MLLFDSGQCQIEGGSGGHSDAASRGEKAGPKGPAEFETRNRAVYFIAASYISATWSQLTK